MSRTKPKTNASNSSGTDPALRLHAFLPASYANGPGRRAVVWVQGCTLACPGCFNPQTHLHRAGRLLPVSQLAAQILALGDQIEGVTISGGEPFQQPRPLLALLSRLRAASPLSILVFSGYRLEELERRPLCAAILEQVDVLIAGRYQAGQRSTAGLIGSRNQTLHCFTRRYSPLDLAASPSAELILGPKGEITVSGIDPFQPESSPEN